MQAFPLVNVQGRQIMDLHKLPRIAFVIGMLVFVSGCRVLEPKAIEPVRNNLPTTLIAEGEPQLVVGTPRPVIDAIGWLIGLPSKIMFWNRRVENHRISAETQDHLKAYLQANGLDQVKVRVNQYQPRDDWRRLRRNTSVAWPWRYTFGAVITLGETLIPGRIFGGDHYNPYTATIHLYSDLPSIAFHEAAHAKDFSNRRYPGNYAALYALPCVSLWHERIATNDVLSYVQYRNDAELRREAYHILYPAYGTYAGNAAGYAVPKYSYPIYIGGILVGHAIGRWRGNQLDDVPALER
jgi:hypothetical protein